MSKRTEAQVSERAALRVSHLAQIEALTKRGLSRKQRIVRYCEAAGVYPLSIISDAVRDYTSLAYVCGYTSLAFVCWSRSGSFPKSLFACWADDTCSYGCPVQRRMAGVPENVNCRWKPTAAELEGFSRVQLDARFP